MSAPLSPVGADTFRSVLRHLPTAVVAVAALIEGEPIGLVVGCFVPASLSPPLVGLFVGNSSTSWPAIDGAGAFCASVLGQHQRDLSTALSKSQAAKFVGVRWHAGPSGHPVLDGCVAWIDCAIEARHPAGDHTLVLARVLGLGIESGDTPLLHHGGRYRRADDLVSA